MMSNMNINDILEIKKKMEEVDRILFNYIDHDSHYGYYSNSMAERIANNIYNIRKIISELSVENNKNKNLFIFIRRGY